ncbi:aldo/keto reductase [Taibaiella sp. KBW10]|uniref:aldo/keto reductase n=1 Tax=Taibaiella sp. KBW10 TaxID=2153357 RepID=UPI001F2A8D8C|nr:aldo/keto reductase [Taibaiella sp. KBW10]
MMHNVNLGPSNLSIAPLIFGGNVFGWTVDEQSSFALLDAFVAAGFNSIDTADVYSSWVPGNTGGESETIIGKWLKQRGKRDDLVIATKLGAHNAGLSAAYMKTAVEASLKRLQTDYIDLYIAHYDDPATPVAETMDAFNALIKEGKVRYIGASNLSAARIKAANQYARENGLEPYISIQPQYNLYDRKPFETEYLPLVEQEHLGVTSYYALASGFLSGKYRTAADLDKSARGNGIKQYLNDRGMRILNALDEVSEMIYAPISQIAIAWQLHKPYITAPIASATSLVQLNDLMAAAQLKLSSEHLALLDDASDTEQ